MGIHLREIIILSLILLFVNAAVGQSKPFVKIHSEKKVRSPNAGSSKSGLFRLKQTLEREREATLEAKANAVEEALENDDRRVLKTSEGCPNKKFTRISDKCILVIKMKEKVSKERAQRVCNRNSAEVYIIRKKLVICHTDAEDSRRALAGNEISASTTGGSDRRILRSNRRCPRGFDDYSRYCLSMVRTRSKWSTTRAREVCRRKNRNASLLYNHTESWGFFCRVSFRSYGRRALKGTEGEINNELDTRRELQSFTCPSGWQRVFNSCYLKKDTPVSWNEAYEFCRDADAHSNLIVIDNWMENAMMAALWAGYPPDTYFWISTANTDETSTDHNYARYQVWSSEWDFVTEEESHGFVCEISLNENRRTLAGSEFSAPTTGESDRRALRSNHRSCPRGFMSAYPSNYCVSMVRTRFRWTTDRARQVCRRKNRNSSLLYNRTERWGFFCRVSFQRSGRRALKGTEAEINNEPDVRRNLGSFQCPAGWQKIADACYFKEETPVSWDEAYEFCRDADSRSNLMIIDDMMENDMMAALWAGYPPDTYFWISGTNSGWKNRDGSHSAYTSTDEEMFVGGSISNSNMDADHKYLRYKVSSAEWDFVTDENSYGFVCEMSFDEDMLDTDYDHMNEAPEFGYDEAYYYDLEYEYDYEQDLEYYLESDEPQTDCLEGWTESEGECFQYVKTQLNFKEAEGYCQELHPEAHLATIQSRVQNEVVANLAEKHSENFIGLKFDAEFGELTWTSGEDVTYTAEWHHETGRTKSSLCTRLVGSRHHWAPEHWDDWDCSKSSRFFCSYSLADEEEEEEDIQDEDTCLNVRVTVLGDAPFNQYSGDYIQLPIDDLNAKPIRLSNEGMFLWHDGASWVIIPSTRSTLEYLVEVGSEFSYDDDMPRNGLFEFANHIGDNREVMVEFECNDPLEDVECDESEANTLLQHSFNNGFLPPFLKDCASVVDTFGAEICDLPVYNLGMFFGYDYFFGNPGTGSDLISDRCPISCGVCEPDNCVPVNTPFNGIYHKTDEIIYDLPVYEDTKGHRLFWDEETWIFVDPNGEIGIMAQITFTDIPEDSSWVALSPTSTSEEFENVPIRGCSPNSECKTLTVGTC